MFRLWSESAELNNKAHNLPTANTPEEIEAMEIIRKAADYLKNQKAKTFHDLANGYPETFPELKQRAKAKILKYYEISILDETEYAAMLRAFFRDNPLIF